MKRIDVRQGLGQVLLGKQLFNCTCLKVVNDLATLLYGGNCNPMISLHISSEVFKLFSLYRISSPLGCWRVSLHNLLTSVPPTSFLLDKGLAFDMATLYK